jgi:hypothetical protein
VHSQSLLSHAPFSGPKRIHRLLRRNLVLSNLQDWKIIGWARFSRRNDPAVASNYVFDHSAAHVKADYEIFSYVLPLASLSWKKVWNEILFCRLKCEPAKRFVK